SSVSLRAATMSSTASAPMMRASQMSLDPTVKSLRSTGRSTAARASVRSPTEPPKNASSVSTDRHAAPPLSYALATTDGTRPGARSPRDGDRRLISAITDRPSPASARSNQPTGTPPIHTSITAGCQAGSVPASKDLGTIVVVEDDPHISDLVDMYL